MSTYITFWPTRHGAVRSKAGQKAAGRLRPPRYILWHTTINRLGVREGHRRPGPDDLRGCSRRRRGFARIVPLRRGLPRFTELGFAEPAAICAAVSVRKPFGPLKRLVLNLALRRDKIIQLIFLHDDPDLQSNCQFALWRDRYGKRRNLCRSTEQVAGP
jgi:hypothetical protein